MVNKLQFQVRVAAVSIEPVVEREKFVREDQKMIVYNGELGKFIDSLSMISELKSQLTKLTLVRTNGNSAVA